MTKGIVFEFLDMGQGDSTLVQLPPWDSGQIWLVDHGKLTSSEIPPDDAMKFLMQRITEICRPKGLVAPRLDYLVITHVDRDHWNRLGNLILGYTGTFKKRIKTDLWREWGTDPNDPKFRWDPGTKLEIANIIYGGDWAYYEKKDSDTAATIFKAILNKKPNNKVLPANYYDKPGDPRFTKADVGCDVYVLSASLWTSYFGSPNYDSVVLLFDYEGRKVILTGDADIKVVETRILERYSSNAGFLKSIALKLGHHGSKASTGEPWLEKVTPKLAFASGDKKWGHPYKEPFDRAVQYLESIENHWCCLSGVGTVNWYYYKMLGGDLTDDYSNIQTEKGMCTNLWYVVKEKPEEKKYEYVLRQGKYVKEEQTHKYGLYTGVQWRLQMDSDPAANFVTCTYQWPVADGQEPPPPPSERA